MAIPLHERTSLTALQNHLNGIIPGYRDNLSQQGLGSGWTGKLVGTARHVAALSFVNGIEIEALDIRNVADFVAHDCGCPARFPSSRLPGIRSQADRFLAYLMDAGLAELPGPIIEGGEHVDRFLCDLTGQGYRESTTRAFRCTCRHFIAGCTCRITLSNGSTMT